MSTTTNPPPAIRHGSCMCKGVTYTVTGDPIRIVRCHCDNCSLMSGGAYRHLMMVATENVAITSGNELVKSYRDTNVGSGTHVDHVFCGNCATTLIAKLAVKPQWTVVVVGTLVDARPEDWIPHAELYVGKRKPGVVAYEGAVQKELPSIFQK